MADPVKIGGAYVENEDHVPNPTDIVAQFNTSGTGAHGRMEEVAPVFEVDKVKTAEEIVGALDPKNTNVSADRVLLPTTETDNEAARKSLLDVAKARVKEGVTIGGPTPAEREAGNKGDTGEGVAVEQERANASQNSVGGSGAGQHAGTDQGDQGPVKASSPAKKAAASQKASSTSKASGDDKSGVTETPVAATPAAAKASDAKDK